MVSRTALSVASSRALTPRARTLPAPSRRKAARYDDSTPAGASDATGMRTMRVRLRPGRRTNSRRMSLSPSLSSAPPMLISWPPLLSAFFLAMRSQAYKRRRRVESARPQAWHRTNALSVTTCRRRRR